MHRDLRGLSLLRGLGGSGGGFCSGFLSVFYCGRFFYILGFDLGRGVKGVCLVRSAVSGGSGGGLFQTSRKTDRCDCFGSLYLLRESAFALPISVLS